MAVVTSCEKRELHFFALVLHLNCTALSQSESYNFFHVYDYFQTDVKIQGKVNFVT